ncbi:aminotransferase class I and II [Gluconacetobacter diazotrophicus PA1 5]|uniref:Aminotransferase n=2 Tax=Gluconacetobacter diazotrophicus TaxID=33996 RepID=A9H8M1_GLUDA|nr:aminotransferase class I/II-fold pyridoxal phosphate-dependent enzyme [Gluconacetobacter diazotrophicus]ACI51175.1 aminotransferase class I and II [Gluconacetobacter diazotrophicus PA1 5]MBB2155112.1 aminotransferase class I/II-fold pyridoxal phosphate-dependent enzyme [Gluconacetobacter diazotrophicus]TWB09731.1 aspartate/methionine/tyrosine aminotransferase [Gluconacetobacter diazotrophicus]CAP54550.1 putative aspartate aminotransferase [Gluconacetobacter diazotrophicus PA1 5]
MTVPRIDPFHAVGLSTLAHRMAAEGRSIVHMEFGQPSTGAPKAAIAEAHRILDSDGMGYWESTPLKARIARHYRDSYDVSVEPEQIWLTCGASPAFVLALNCCFAPGARIALARPGYVAYRNTLRALYLEPVEIACGPAERFQLSAAAIAALDPPPDGVILASPANPTGTILSTEEMQAIVALCRARGIRIISDEIYHGLSYIGPVRSVLQDDPDALVVNSFSKYFSMAGWRLGWLVVPPALVEAAQTRVGNMFLTPPSLSQHAGLVAFDCREELEGHVRMYRHNRDLMLEHLPALGLSRIAPPDGAFYIYADIGHLTDDSLAFCARLLAETGVATAPGLDFDPMEGHRFMRFSFAVSTDRLEEALRRMTPWFARARDAAR